MNEIRDVRVQLEIDTGAGTMCPVTDDYFVLSGIVDQLAGIGMPIDSFDKKPASEGPEMCSVAVEKLYHVDNAKRARWFMRTLWSECQTHPKAVICVIEVGK